MIIITIIVIIIMIIIISIIVIIIIIIIISINVIIMTIISDNKSVNDAVLCSFETLEFFLIYFKNITFHSLIIKISLQAEKEGIPLQTVMAVASIKKKV